MHTDRDRMRARRRPVVAATVAGVGAVGALVVLGLARAEAGPGGESVTASSILEYKENFCVDNPLMCPENPTVPTVTTPEIERRFDAAASVADGSVERADAPAVGPEWSQADADRLFQAVQATDCLDAVGTQVASQDEADALGKAQSAADLQPVLDEYWAAEAHAAFRERWNVGHASVWLYPDRHAPMECRLAAFDIKRVRQDAGGLMVVVRRQRLLRYFDPQEGARHGADGWEVENEHLASTDLYLLRRDEAGRIMVVEREPYEDPTDADIHMGT